MEFSKRKLTMMVLLTLGGLCLVVMLATLPALGTIIGDQPPAAGDWIIDNPTTVRDHTIMVEGNLTINDMLTLDNGTIIMNLTMDDGAHINVTSTGNLIAKDSNFTSNYPWLEYGFWVNGKMDLKDTILDECSGGIRILTQEKVTLDSCLISDRMRTAPPSWTARSSQTSSR
jgi:hypothetical protein